jgi:predicted GTPase
LSVIIWDGGNNDGESFFSSLSPHLSRRVVLLTLYLFCIAVPFYKPDIHITLVDSLRPTDELKYFPGETNVRMADVILITKVKELKSIQEAHDHAKNLEKLLKPHTPVFFGSSVITPEAKDAATGEQLSTDDAVNLIKGKRVLVIDDGPTLTHGGMAYGAGYVCAEQLGAAEIVDPRPYAQGSLIDVFNKFPHLKNVLPAMGYDEQQVRDLEATIRATPCDAIVIGTPSDITHLFDVQKPFVMAKYDLQVFADHEADFKAMLDTFYVKFQQHHHDAEMMEKWSDTRAA